MIKIDRVVVGHLETNCWIVSNDKGDIAVIDPGDDTDAICAVIDGLAPEHKNAGAVILTHGHFDHVGSADEVADDNGSFVYMSEEEFSFIQGEQGTGGREFDLEAPVPIVDFKFHDGDTLEVGALKFDVIMTPGHTPGSVCLLLQDDADEQKYYLFSGDTLFAQSIGRTDLVGGDETKMAQSLERLDTLPDNVEVFPGHGTTTTLELERAINQFWPR